MKIEAVHAMTGKKVIMDYKDVEEAYAHNSINFHSFKCIDTQRRLF